MTREDAEEMLLEMLDAWADTAAWTRKFPTMATMTREQKQQEQADCCAFHDAFSKCVDAMVKAHG